MNEIGPRPLLHLHNARFLLAHGIHSLRAARTELHKTGPQAHTAALILKNLDRSFLRLQRLIQQFSPPHNP